jgi:hypothetical protein
MVRRAPQVRPHGHRARVAARGKAPARASVPDRDRVRDGMRLMVRRVPQVRLHGLRAKVVAKEMVPVRDRVQWLVKGAGKACARASRVVARVQDKAWACATTA